MSPYHRHTPTNSIRSTPTTMTDTPEKFDTLPPTTWGRHTLTWGAKTWVMGILNITPDSFSQDGLAADGVATDAIVAAAVAWARQMVADGAEMLDIGGESTR